MRALTIVVALLLGLIGLLMSLCGGGFLLNSLFAPGDAWIAVIAVPCVLAGLGLLWGASKLFRRANRN
jgi:hypothetical protein